MTLSKMLEGCSQEERAAAMLLFKEAETTEAAEAVIALVRAGRMRRARARYEIGDDDQGRKTMPARIPAALAAKYEAVARARRMSVYAWMREAMDRQYRRDTDPKERKRARRRERDANRRAAARIRRLLDEGVV